MYYRIIRSCPVRIDNSFFMSARSEGSCETVGLSEDSLVAGSKMFRVKLLHCMAVFIVFSVSSRLKAMVFRK